VTVLKNDKVINFLTRPLFCRTLYILVNMHTSKTYLRWKEERNVHAILFDDCHHGRLARQWNNASMSCQVFPRVCWIQVTYRRQLYAHVQRSTCRVDAIHEEVTELQVTPETEQKSGPCRVVGGPRVAAATWQQSCRQTSVISTTASSSTHSSVNISNSGNTNGIELLKPKLKEIH